MAIPGARPQVTTAQVTTRATRTTMAEVVVMAAGGRVSEASEATGEATRTPMTRLAAGSANSGAGEATRAATAVLVVLVVATRTVTYRLHEFLRHVVGYRGVWLG
jgi:hypothetical protein